MHWYIMQSLVKCLFQMFTVCSCAGNLRGSRSAMTFFIVQSMINLNQFPFGRHQTALLLSEAFAKSAFPSSFDRSLSLSASLSTLTPPSFMCLFLDLLVLLQLHVQVETRNKMGWKLVLVFLFLDFYHILPLWNLLVMCNKKKWSMYFYHLFLIISIHSVSQVTF